MAHGIEITKTDDGRICVTSPYHPDFVSEAKRLKGRWNPGLKAWCFDPRDEEGVREALREVYGTDGSPVETADVRIRMGWASDEQRAVWLGRIIAERRFRDSAVRLGDGCIVVEGDFYSSGGSRRYPEIGPAWDVVVEVRDVPLPLVERAQGDDRFIEIVRRHPAPVPEAEQEEETVETLLARLMEATGEGTAEAAIRAALRIITKEEE